MKNKDKKIKALRKTLKKREEVLNYWIREYWESRSELAAEINEKENELNVAVRIFARILKEMESLG